METYQDLIRNTDSGSVATFIIESIIENDVEYEEKVEWDVQMAFDACYANHDYEEVPFFHTTRELHEELSLAVQTNILLYDAINVDFSDEDGEFVAYFETNKSFNWMSDDKASAIKGLIKLHKEDIKR